MSDHKSRFEKWQKEAKEKFDEIDKQIGLKDKIGEGGRVVGETAQKGAQRIKTEAESSEVGKQAVRATEETIKTAGKAAKKAGTQANLSAMPLPTRPPKPVTPFSKPARRPPTLPPMRVKTAPKEPTAFQRSSTLA